jgi:ZU5 domain
MSKTRALLFALVPGVILACSDADTPSAPSTPTPVEVGAFLSQVSSGTAGITGFHFFPPIAESTVAESARDKSLLDLLSVEICEWNGTACVQPVLRRLTSKDDPPAGLTISDDGVYQALWKTQGSNLDPARNYRVRVLASGGELGHVDVDVVGSGRDPASPAGYVRMNAGSTLPVTFVVEKGIGARVGAAGGTITLANGVRLTFPAGALPQDVFITAVPATNLPPSNKPIVPGTAWDFGPDGLVFAKPVVVTIPYDPAAVPAGVPQAELRIHKLVNGSYEQQDAGLVDLVNHTVSAELKGFSVYVIIQRDPQNLQDVEAPEIRAFEVRNSTTPTFGGSTTLDVSTGDATLFTRLAMVDNGSGVGFMDLRWFSPTGRQLRFPCYRGGAPETGSDTNGEWICTAIFPRHAEGGLWRADVVWIRDKVENQALFVNNGQGGFCQTNKPTNCLTSLPQVTVVSATPDVNPPVLQTLGVSLDVQPRAFGASVAVDAGLSARRVWFGFPATDNLTGIGGFQIFDYFWLQLIGPSNQFVDFLRTCSLTQGTNVNGFWECFVDIPAQAQTGTWRLARLRVPDRAGNGGWSGFSDFVPNGTSQLCNPGGNCVPSPTIQVTSTGDGAAPTLESVSIQANAGQVTTTLGLTDNISGLSFVRVQYTSAVTTQFQQCIAPRTSGTSTNGTWACTINFSALAALGRWDLFVEVQDVAGNRRSYNRRASDGFMCYFDTGTNTQVCKDFGDTDLILE